MKWRPLTHVERERLAYLADFADSRLTFEERQERRRLVDLAVRERIGLEEEAARAGRRPPAEQFLIEQLAHGPRVGVELVAEAAKQGIRRHQVGRAKGKLGVEQWLDDGRKRYMWRLAK